MGNETFYCVQCGIRVHGSDRLGDRSHCPGCLPAEPAARDSSKRIRRPSSGALVAVAARPRTTRIDPPRRSRALLFGGLSLAGAALAALAPLLSSGPAGPTSTVIVAPPREVKPATKLPGSFMAEPPPPPPATTLPGSFVAAPPPPVDPAVEALAREIEEAASILADEGRFEDALVRIRSFPAEHRGTRAGAGLDGLRRQIEARARSR